MTNYCQNQVAMKLDYLLQLITNTTPQMSWSGVWCLKVASEKIQWCGRRRDRQKPEILWCDDDDDNNDSIDGRYMVYPKFSTIFTVENGASLSRLAQCSVELLRKQDLHCYVYCYYDIIQMIFVQNIFCLPVCLVGRPSFPKLFKAIPNIWAKKLYQQQLIFESLTIDLQAPYSRSSRT